MARTGCCSSCCKMLKKFSLLMINTADAAIGCAALGLAVYLRSSKAGAEVAVQHAVHASLFLAGAFLLGAALGFGGTVFDSPCALRLSGLLAIPLAVVGVGAGIYMATMKDSCLDYIAKATPDEEQIASHYYWFVVGGVFGGAVLEMIRYSLARNLSRTLSSEADDLRVSLAAEEAASNARREVSEAARTGRFDQLRAYYRDKYNPPEPDEEAASVGAASSRNPFEDDSDGDEVTPLHGESPAKAAQPWYAGL